MKGFKRTRPVSCWLLLAAVFCLFAPTARGESVDSLPQPTDYVSDFAHVLSPQAIAQIDSVCGQLDHSQANAQIAVVTVHSLDGDEAADYATKLYDKWKIGKKGTDKGVLVLLAIDDHKRFIETGYGVEGILNDAKVGDIGRAMVPYLRAKDYNSAVALAVGQVAQAIATDANVTLTDEPAPAPEPTMRAHRGHDYGGLLILLFLLLFVGGGSIFRMLLGYGLLSSFFDGDRWGRGGWGGGGGGWGGGGFGGGGGGGGFGGFGGGSTGGGGAGGSW